METKLRYTFGPGSYNSNLLVLFPSVPKLFFNNKFHSCAVVQSNPHCRIAVMRSKLCSHGSKKPWMVAELADMGNEFVY